MTFTLNDVALLALVLLIGLFLGLMMSGRGKYKRLWKDELASHKLTAKDRDTRLAAADARVAELEAQRVRVTPAPSTAIPGAAGGPDDLTAIRTVSAQDQIALNEAGYHRYDQIAAMNAEQQATIEARLGRQPGIIARDEWPAQARLLNAGKHDEHRRLYEGRTTPV